MTEPTITQRMMTEIAAFEKDYVRFSEMYNQEVAKGAHVVARAMQDETDETAIAFARFTESHMIYFFTFVMRGVPEGTQNCLDVLRWEALTDQKSQDSDALRYYAEHWPRVAALLAEWTVRGKVIQVERDKRRSLFEALRDVDQPEQL